MAPEENDRFELSRHGLAHLEGQDVLMLPEYELDRLLKALGDEDIAVRVPITSTPANIEKLLSSAECRRCGNCCSPDIPNPDNPGIEALEDELKDIAKELGVSYQSLEEKTSKGKKVFHPSYMQHISLTRYLPLPCPFYDVEGKRCPIHSVRPVVCRLHPIVFGEQGMISIRTACDYGKDILKAAFREIKANAPETVMRI